MKKRENNESEKIETENIGMAEGTENTGNGNRLILESDGKSELIEREEDRDDTGGEKSHK